MLKIQKIRANAQIPHAATEGSAGVDLCAALDRACTIEPGALELIPTGLAMAIPRGYAGFIFARSGLGIRHGVVPGNCVGVIDSDYRGEVAVGLRNHGAVAFTVQPGDRIAQMVLMPVLMPEMVVCDNLEETARGAGGFGSTGR